MKKRLLGSCLLCVAFVASVGAHDLFLKLDSYFLRPNSKATVRLMNGTFLKSEAIVARDRLRDTSVILPSGETLHPSPSDYRDETDATFLDLQTGKPGTYLVSLSTKPRESSRKAIDFNDFLKHDGIPDILAERERKGEMGKDVRYTYSKHVKAVLQVGGARTDNFDAVLNYPVEIVAKKNPYSLKVGGEMEAQCLKDGKPIANQSVIAGGEARGSISPEIHLRADADGVVRFKLKAAGKWYVKFINMTAVNDPNINYESKWATLTFEIR